MRRLGNTRNNEETRLDAFGMIELRQILRVSWTAKKTNEWVLNKAGVKRELLYIVLLCTWQILLLSLSLSLFLDLYV